MLSPESTPSNQALDLLSATNQTVEMFGQVNDEPAVDVNEEEEWAEFKDSSVSQVRNCLHLAILIVFDMLLL